MAAKTTYPHFVDPQDVDFTLRASISHLIAKTLNVAGVDADSKGFGIRELKPQNRSWVLSRMAIEISHRPREYTPYNITTWVRDYGRAMSTRNFVLGCEGEVFGSATTQWSMIDFNTRRAVDLRYIAEHNDAVWAEEPPIERAGKLPAVDAEAITEHRVAYSDIDFNRHMNSLRYFDLMLDCLPLEILTEDRAVRIDINFLNETRYGQLLRIGYRNEGDRWEFEIATEDGTIACRTTFEWR